MISFFKAFSYLRRFSLILGLRTYLAVIFSFLGSLIESFGLLALVPLLLTLDNRASNVEIAPWIPEKLITVLSELETVTFLLLFLSIFIARGIFQLISLVIISTLKGQLLKKLKLELLEAYSNVDFMKFTQGSIGGFNNAIGEQATKSIQAFNFLVLMVSSLLSAIVFLAVGLMANFTVGVLLMFTSFVVFLLFGRINTFARNLSRETVKQHSTLADAIVHLFSGFRYLRATGLINIEKTKSSDAIIKLSKLQIMQGNAQALTAAVREPLVVLIVIFVIFLHVVVNDGSVSSVLVSMILFYRGFNSFHTVQVNTQRSFDFIASFEFVDNELKEYRKRRGSNGNQQFKEFKSEIEFKNVSFSVSQSILRDVNLKIQKGSCVALAGASGSGKTTIANLITGNLKPTSGVIKIDGINIDEMDLTGWRSLIGYVDQETWMPSGTIFENITYGVLSSGDKSDAEVRVKDILQTVGLWDWVSSLNEGMNLKIEDFGKNLSGGQRQRLAIARELFRAPEVLILDEATSALDVISETAIIEILRKLQGKVTIIIIAHKLGSIKFADMIHFIEKGTVIEAGNFSDLMSNEQGKFRATFSAGS